MTVSQESRGITLQLRFAKHTLVTEANGVTDNPLVFAESGDILSGGNFHAETVAMAADMLAIALQRKKMGVHSGAKRAWKSFHSNTVGHFSTHCEM